MSDEAKNSGKARRRRTVDDIDAEIARLKEQRRELRVRSAERFARIALETGLADLRITDEEIEAAFQTLAGRFRGPEHHESRRPNSSAPPARGEADAKAGA
jgi:hypothetical protein